MTVFSGLLSQETSKLCSQLALTCAFVLSPLSGSCPLPALPPHSLLSHCDFCKPCPLSSPPEVVPECDGQCGGGVRLPGFRWDSVTVAVFLGVSGPCSSSTKMGTTLVPTSEVLGRRKEVNTLRAPEKYLAGSKPRRTP